MSESPRAAFRVFRVSGLDYDGAETSAALDPTAEILALDLKLALWLLLPKVLHLQRNLECS
jgi:hypothetical protein